MATPAPKKPAPKKAPAKPTAPKKPAAKKGPGYIPKNPRGPQPGFRAWAIKVFNAGTTPLKLADVAERMASEFKGKKPAGYFYPAVRSIYRHAIKAKLTKRPLAEPARKASAPAPKKAANPAKAKPAPVRKPAPKKPAAPKADDLGI